MRNAFIRSLAFICVLSLLGFSGVPICYAYPFPAQTLISTEAELTEWYRNSTDDGVLTQSVSIAGDVKLIVPIGVQEDKILAPTTLHLRVDAGASLTIDNPRLQLVGSHKAVIIVETGGRLVLGRFAGIHVTPDTYAIVIKQGGTLETPYGVPSDVRINNENLPPNLLPPDPPPDTRTPITSILDDKAHISCAVGERPDSSQYLATIYAYFGGIDRAELAVNWELSTVDFNKAGTYHVAGTPTDAGMQAHNLSNPKGLTATMTITVYEKGSLTDVRGEFLSVGSGGNAIAWLILPALPTDEISALYIYKSADRQAWEKATCNLFPTNGVTPTGDNFLLAVTTVGSSSYLPLHYQTDYKPLWVRVEVVGSDRAGMSNAVQIKLPSGTAPGDIVHEDSNEEAGDSGGNRGGVGQEETDRVLPTEEETTKQAVIPVAASRADPAAPDVVATHPLEATPVPEEKPVGDVPIMAEPQASEPACEPAPKADVPSLPGAVTAAVCTTAAVAAASLLLRCNWQAIHKLIKRKS